MKNELKDYSEITNKIFDITKEVEELDKLGILDANMSQRIEGKILDIFDELNQLPKQLASSYKKLFSSMMEGLSQEIAEKMPELSKSTPIRELLNNKLQKAEVEAETTIQDSKLTKSSHYKGHSQTNLRGLN